jgi:hypothetical protein
LTSTKDVRIAASINRQIIMEALAPFTEEDINKYTCPLGMTCSGISLKIGRHPTHAYLDLKWLKENGYVRVIGSRAPTGFVGIRSHRSKVFVLTEKGRKALNPVGKGGRDLVGRHGRDEYDARAVHPERPPAVDGDE